MCRVSSIGDKNHYTRLIIRPSARVQIITKFIYLHTPFGIACTCTLKSVIKEKCSDSDNSSEVRRGCACAEGAIIVLRPRRYLCIIGRHGLQRSTRAATFEAGEEFLEVCAVLLPLLYVQIYYCREGQ